MRVALQDGDMFKARIEFAPYFYIQARGRLLPCPTRVL